MMVLRHKSVKDHPESPRVCQELCADKVSETLGPHSGSPALRRWRVRWDGLDQGGGVS